MANGVVKFRSWLFFIETSKPVALRSLNCWFLVRKDKKKDKKKDKGKDRKKKKDKKKKKKKKKKILGTGKFATIDSANCPVGDPKGWLVCRTFFCASSP